MDSNAGSLQIGLTPTTLSNLKFLNYVSKLL
jgi:hypothetical protein